MLKLMPRRARVGAVTLSHDRIFDAAGNAVGVVKGSMDLAENGPTLQSGLQVVGSGLGLAGNSVALKGQKFGVKSAPEAPSIAPETPHANVAENTSLKGEFRGRMINVEKRKINLRKGDPNITGSGIEYAWKNHGGSGPNSKSQFTISKDELKKILQQKNVIDSPIRQSGTTENYIREVDVVQLVGKLPVNKGGVSTSVVTVITDVKGNIVNVFPGDLGRSATLP